MCFFLNFACAISWTLKIRIELSVFLLFCLLWITKVYPWQDSASLSERKSLWPTFVRIGERLISRCCQPSSSSVFQKWGLEVTVFKTGLVYGTKTKSDVQTWIGPWRVLHMNVFVYCLISCCFGAEWLSKDSDKESEPSQYLTGMCHKFVKWIPEMTFK